MERAASVIGDILQEVLVQSAEQPVQGVDSNTCIRYMNRFMASMGAYGVTLGYTNIKSPSDLITIEPGGVEGLVFNTALRLCNSYDIPVNQSLVLSAKEGKNAMFKLARNPQKTQHPDTLPIGSGNEKDRGAGVFSKFYHQDESIEQEQFGTILLESNTNEQEN